MSAGYWAVQMVLQWADLWAVLMALLLVGPWVAPMAVQSAARLVDQKAHLMAAQSAPL